MNAQVQHQTSSAMPILFSLMFFGSMFSIVVRYF
jgi:hypothetical protein